MALHHMEKVRVVRIWLKTSKRSLCLPSVAAVCSCRPSVFTWPRAMAARHTVCGWRWAPAGGPGGRRAGWRWAGECSSFPCGHSRSPRSCRGWIWRGCATRRSGALFLNSSARTPARPQTHEPGERKKRDDGLSPEGETGAEGGENRT